MVRGIASLRIEADNYPAERLVALAISSYVRGGTVSVGAVTFRQVLREEHDYLPILPRSAWDR